MKVQPRTRQCTLCGKECYGLICRECYCSNKYKGKAKKVVMYG